MMISGNNHHSNINRRTEASTHLTFRDEPVKTITPTGNNKHSERNSIPNCFQKPCPCHGMVPESHQPTSQRPSGEDNGPTKPSRVPLISNKIIILERRRISNRTTEVGENVIMYNVSILDGRGGGTRSTFCLTAQETRERILDLVDSSSCNIFYCFIPARAPKSKLFFKAVNSRMAASILEQDATTQTGTRISAARILVLRDCPLFNQQFGIHAVSHGASSAQCGTSSSSDATYHLIIQSEAGAMLRCGSVQARVVQACIDSMNTKNCVFRLFLCKNKGKEIRHVGVNKQLVQELLQEDSFQAPLGLPRWQVVLGKVPQLKKFVHRNAVSNDAFQYYIYGNGATNQGWRNDGVV